MQTSNNNNNNSNTQSSTYTYYSIDRLVIADWGVLGEEGGVDIFHEQHVVYNETATIEQLSDHILYDSSTDACSRSAFGSNYDDSNTSKNPTVEENDSNQRKNDESQKRMFPNNESSVRFEGLCRTLYQMTSSSNKKSSQGDEMSKNDENIVDSGDVSRENDLEDSSTSIKDATKVMVELQDSTTLTVMELEQPLNNQIKSPGIVAMIQIGPKTSNEATTMSSPSSELLLLMVQQAHEKYCSLHTSIASSLCGGDNQISETLECRSIDDTRSQQQQTNTYTIRCLLSTYYNELLSKNQHKIK